MKKIILIFLLLPCIGYTKPKIGNICSNNKIYCHILKNKPTVNKVYAMKLSNVIYRKAKKLKINPFLFSSIVAQESYYKLNAVNCISGLVTEFKVIKGKNRIIDLNKSEEVLREIKVCTDFGLTQIHYKTAKRYNFEIKKLTVDMNYSVNAGMKILADLKKRYKRKEKYWWTRYNSSTPIKREIYRKMVGRFL